MVRPIFDLVEPRKCKGEGGVVPAFSDPRCVVNHSEGSERFNQVDGPSVERTIHGVRIKQVRECGLLFLAVSLQHHPQILNRRSCLRVVEIDEIRRIVTPQ